MNLLLDGNHDLAMVGGQLSVSGGLAQRIDCRLRTIMGEWWLDGSIGVPYFTEIFKKSPDLVVVRQALLTVIQAVPGVAHVDSLVLDFDRRNRSLAVTFSARGLNGSDSGSSVVSI